MTRTQKIMAAFIAASVAISGNIMGCTKNAANDPDTLYVGLSAAPSTLDPRIAMDAVGMRLTSLIFSSIVRLGPDFEITGEAASHWAYKDLTYTFSLRPGLTFVTADGKTIPVTAADIDFSLESFRKSGRFASSLEPIDSFQTDYNFERGGKLVIKLKTYAATFLTDLTPVKIIPKDIVTTNEKAFREHPVGTGPFRLVSNSTNEILLTQNTSCTYSKPKIKNIAFKIVREDSTRFLKILKGEIDLVQQELPPSKAIELEKRGGFQIYKYPGLSMSYILVNLKDKSLKSLNVRKALSLAINRDEIIRFKLEGLAEPATSILSPLNPFHNGALKVPQYDLAEAKRLVQEAGLTNHEIILKTSNSSQAVENGRVIANQLESTGLKVKLQSFEWATFYKDIDQGNFQLATMKWVGTTDPDIYKVAFHSNELPPKGRNRGSYINPEIDKLVDQGRGIENIRKRIDHYKKVQKIIYEDLPIIPLWYEYEVAIASPRVKNFSPSKNGDYSSLTKIEKSKTSDDEFR